MNINIIKTIKYTLYTYFTYFPYLVYNYSVNNGNLALAGIGIGLIHLQHLFWILNTVVLVIIYNFQNVNLYYINIFLFIFCIFLYIISLSKVIYLINLLKMALVIL